MEQKTEMLYYSKSVGGEHRIYAQPIQEQTDTHITLVNQKLQLPKSVVGTKKSWHGYYYFYSFKELNDFLNPTAGYETEYMLLDRLRSDCDYYLGYGNKNPKNLWAGNVKDQIAKMRELYEKLPEKPEWLTEADIDNYERDMLAE